MNAPAALPTADRWRLRASDFEVLHDAGALAELRRAELIDGDIYAMSPQLTRHARGKTRLAYALAARLASLRSAAEVITEVSVTVSEHSVPQPDIVVTSYKGDGFMPAETVLLAVEVSDTTLASDLGRKADLYAAAGIPEYWVVDFDGQRILVHSQPDSGRYRKRADVPFRAPLVAATIDGLRIDTSVLVAGRE